MHGHVGSYFVLNALDRVPLIAGAIVSALDQPDGGSEPGLLRDRAGVVGAG